MGTTFATHGMAQSQSRAKRMAGGMMESENHDGIHLGVQDMVREAGYCIYVYNLLDKEHIVNQEPKWKRFLIPACPKGEKFSFTMLPAFTKDTFFKASDPNEISYRLIDGEKDATSLLNPDAYPGTNWEAQLVNWDSPQTAITGDGNNLNKWACFWSMTAPDEEEKLFEEIKIFKDIVVRTMNNQVKQAELLAAQGKMGDITPNMHFAMDYLGKQANWHMSLVHMVDCPTCGEPVKDGIAYHKNSMGEKCVVDYDRCVKLGIIKAEAADVPHGTDEPEPPVRTPARPVAKP